MHLKKFLLFGLMAAVLPAFAEEVADRKTATSLKYVTHELDTRQNKFTAEQNKAMEYTNTAGDVQKRAVTSDLDNGGTDSLPMVGGVNTKLATKQDDIAPINDHTAVTYTGQSGSIGAKGIYQATESYAAQSNDLIDAKTFNAALKRGLDSEFLCSEYKPGTDLCWVWSIHNTEPVSINLFDMSSIPTTTAIVHNADGSITVTTTATNGAVSTDKKLSQLAPGLRVGKTYKFSINTTGTSKYIYLNSISMSWSNGESRTITQDMLNSLVLLYASGVSTTATISDIRITEVNPEMPFETLVPSDYTPVEYIRFTGEQWLDTDFIMQQSANPKVELVITNKSGSAFGAQSEQKRALLDFNDRIYCGSGNNRLSYTMPSNDNKKHTLTAAYISATSNLIISVDGTVVNSGVQAGSFPTNTTYYVGNIKGGSAGINTLSGDVHSFRIYQNDSVVLNLVPAKNSSGVVGMYDTVSNTFLENAGNGTFTAGPDINNIIYIPQGQ